MFSNIDPQKILDVSYGFFRLTSDHYRRIRKRRPLARFLAEEFQESDNLVSYSPQQQAATQERHLQIISRFIDPGRIFPAT